MEDQLSVRCSQNQALAFYLWTKRKEITENPSQKELSEKLDSTLTLAYRNICKAKDPISTLKDLSRIKGVGKWILRLMKGAFENDQDALPSQEAARNGNGKKHGVPKRYLPQKNSVAYALLITLYRGTANGNEFMRKQELIDEADASGLSRTLIGQHGGKGKHRQCGTSAKDWYTGWSCMKTLVDRGLVVKSSCPAKYMLTEEGKRTARECLSRSGLISPGDSLTAVNLTESSGYIEGTSEDVTLSSNDTSCDKEQSSVQIDLDMNYEDNDVDSFSAENEVQLAATASEFLHTDVLRRPFTPQACSKVDHTAFTPAELVGTNCVENFLAMPPSADGERFKEVYDVILLLDDRENFGSRFSKVVDGIRSQFKIQVEVRRLLVGDGIWIARHRKDGQEYVLDFIVERKRIDDLCSSIRDNRYKDQKLRLLRCGLQKLIYLIEGDPNSSEAAERIKTACLTTEILEGFDVQRTTGITDTVKKYGYLTQSIIDLYTAHFPDAHHDGLKQCPTFEEFIRRCQDHERLSITDVFSLQLMQIPQVTEEMALAIVKMYPTLHSLALAYAALGRDVCTQEEMLRFKGLTSAAASRNIFRFVWGG